MSSGIINDALQDNLVYLEAQTNVILDELAQLRLFNADLITSTEEVNIIQDTFADLSNVVMQLKKQKTTGSNFDLNNKFLDLRKISSLLRPFKDGSLTPQALSSQESQIVSRLESLILQYSLISIYQITLTSLLRSTAPLSDELFYWEVISASTWRKVLFCLQTTPQRTAQLVNSVIADFHDASKPNLEAMNVTVPSYIGPHWESTYKFFIHYQRLITDSLYNNILANNIRGIYKFIGAHSLRWDKNINPVPFAKVMLGAPFLSVFEEVHRKKHQVYELQAQNAKNLGLLLANLPNLEEIDNNEHKITQSLSFLQATIKSSKEMAEDPFQLINQIFDEQLPDALHEWKVLLSRSRRPSFITRYWPSLILTLLYGPSTVMSILTNRDAIIEFIQTNLVDTVKGMWNNWILKPAVNILSTIRHDDQSEISIMSQHSLDSDLESLKRMVIDYTVENTPEYKHLSFGQLEEVKRELNDMVSSGDLTPMMKGYEEDIKRPVKNLIRGSLPRALLIQLQKTKVDGAVAISGIDKLLKSQELVFGIVAASPSFLIIVYLFKALNSYLQKGYISRNSGERRLIVSKNLNNIERLLSSSEDAMGEELDYINGMLLLEIISLRNSGLTIVPKVRRSEWVRDINDLADNKASIQMRLNTVTRIYHVYSAFF
jgi:nuclear-control-of-ATPase protein 2